MDDPKNTKPNRPHLFVYHGTVPPALALLLVVPLLFFLLSFAALALVGGALAAFVLPLFLRKRRLHRTDTDCITLERDQYSRIESDAPRLPRP
jgi:hypothetical protein